jgi:hypothetical protein
MKKYSKFFLTVSLFSCIAVSCTTMGNIQNLPVLADSGEWALQEISLGGETVTIDRDQLGAFEDAFTLRVAKTDEPDSYVFSGKAAPNRFNMPVKVGEDGGLTVSPPAATLMAAFMEPEVLKEREYLQYLENISLVQMSGSLLVLETADEAGQPVSLYFAPFAARE